MNSVTQPQPVLLEIRLISDDRDVDGTNNEFSLPHIWAKVTGDTPYSPDHL